ncbi:hypothetical protein M9H77_00041 [Catharanthus roseus]|nr:hypothetical protein M9H77_00041 [Catharanthus roseus]
MPGSAVECEIYPLLRVGPRSLTQKQSVMKQRTTFVEGTRKGIWKKELQRMSTYRHNQLNKVRPKSSLSSGSESVHGISTTVVDDLAGAEPRSRYPSAKLVGIASESQEELRKFITLTYPDREGHYDQVPVSLALIGECLKPQCKESHLASLTYWYGLASVTPKPLVLAHCTLKVSSLRALPLTKGSGYGASARPENCVPTLYDKNSSKKQYSLDSILTLFLGTQEPIGRWDLDVKHYGPGSATISIVNLKEKIAQFGVLETSYVLGILPEGSGKPLHLNGGFNGTAACGERSCRLRQLPYNL